MREKRRARQSRLLADPDSLRRPRCVSSARRSCRCAQVAPRVRASLVASRARPAAASERQRSAWASPAPARSTGWRAIRRLSRQADHL